MRRATQSITALVLAAEVVGLAGAQQAHDGQEQHQHHTPATYYGTVVSTAVVSSGAAFTAESFRVYYAQPIETLTDEVSKYLPRAPITVLVSGAVS